MLVATHQPPPYAMPPMGISFGNPQASEDVQKVADFFQTLRTEVIEPTKAKGAYQFRSSIPQLTSALAQVCGGSGNTVEEFLRVIDCWMSEAFGWWTEAEIIGRQTEQIGDALLAAIDAAKVQIAASINAPPGRSLDELEAVVKAARLGGLSIPDFNFSILRKQETLGRLSQRVGRELARQGTEWKGIVRNADKLSPILRDTWTLVNDGLETGELSEADPQTAAFIAGLKASTNDWKFQIVNRVTDLAFMTRNQAQEISRLNQDVIRSQFQLAALAPVILENWQVTLDRLNQLMALIRTLSLPGRAITGLADVTGRGLKAILKPLGDILLKVGLAVGIGAAGIATLLYFWRRGRES